MATRHAWSPGLLVMTAALAFASPAFAQYVAAPTAPPQTRPHDATALTETTSQVQAVPLRKTGPTFWIFGVPIELASPVPPPYESTSFNDLGGQPMNSVDQVMSQQFTDLKR